MRRANKFRVVGLALSTAALVGCVELQYWVGGQLIGAPPAGGSNNENQSGGGNDNSNNANDNSGSDNLNDNANMEFSVELMVSNETPEVGEEVILICVVTSGSPDGAMFAFQPESERLMVNEETGRATFVVAESDVDIAFVVQCAAENAEGQTAVSETVMIIANESPVTPTEP